MRYLLAAALILFSMVGVSFAAESVEIRSEILWYGSSDWLQDWAAFYYDLKNNICTEQIYLSIYEINNYGGSDYDNPLSPGHINILYSTSPVIQKFEYNWTVLVEEPDWNWNGEDWEESIILVPRPTGFAVIGFFGEPYVALNNETILYNNNMLGRDMPAFPNVGANKIAPLVVNDNTKYSLKVGDSIDLGKGYALYVEQIDVGGNKTNLILKHGDTQLGSGIVTASESGGDWIFEKDLLNMPNVHVLRVHVKDVFHGNDAIVEIDGLWLIDYLNAFEVKSDVNYGKWNATSINSEELVYIAEDIALSSNATIALGKDWNLKVQDGFNPMLELRFMEPNNRFYLFKEYTEPGTYEIRSSVSDCQYTYNNFAAFYYDLDKNLATEVLNAYAGYDGQFEKEDPDSFSYTTTYVHADYKYLPNDGFDEDDILINSWDSGYDIMGYFGELYVPLNVVDGDGFYVYESTKLDKFAPLVMDDDSKYTLKTGDWIELGNNYTLHVRQIDIKGNKAHLELQKDGVFVNSSIVTTKSGDGSSNWIYKDILLNVKDVQHLRVHVKDVFQGQDELVEIDGIWLMDYNNVTDLKSGDEVGLLKYEGLSSIDSVDGYGNLQRYSSPNALYKVDAESVLVFTLKNNLTLTDEMDLVIANNMSLKAYKSDYFPLPNIARGVAYGFYGEYNYYFYVTEEIGNLSSGNDGDGDSGNGDGNKGSGDSSNKSSETTNPENETKPGKLAGGIGAIVLGLFLLIALILIAYLYRRYKTRMGQSQK
ncbi:S-layer protein (TIGR01567 family) [Methanimicrococcus blatticola]|uniref:S-layer protein (TIGR01567 family) n=2 Tax=Methanimicrococcus blatticola TaxID=91560 RepID=A0A484F4Z8_9EURY|nr:hypothetical protein [Methanimicrococcus blatticola]TDQ68896.1 S-layer protein (TIGR01567 family) [Methanimicrococcus blatticola]